jgi:hypothetical protein
MKVFVGFGYNDDDKWIEDLVIPFVEALGCEVLTGEEMHGEDLSDGVMERIKKSDVCVGLLTKRGLPDANGVFGTHMWVIQELTTAFNFKKPFFEIREKVVDPQKGMLGSHQRYTYEDKAFLLLEIAKFINKEKLRLTHKRFMLLPSDFSEAIRPHAKFTTCSYKFMHGNAEYEPEVAELKRFAGGYGIIVKQIPSDEALIQITVDGPGGSWTSDFVPVGHVNINLLKD